MLPSELLADPAAWIQGYLAQDKHRRVVAVDNPAACRFCVLGALAHAMGPKTLAYLEGYSKLRAVLEAEGWDAGPVFFNDMPGRTHAEVFALLKKAGL